jgi:hypothetical protein
MILLYSVVVTVQQRTWLEERSFRVLIYMQCVPGVKDDSSHLILWKCKLHCHDNNTDWRSFIAPIIVLAASRRVVLILWWWTCKSQSQTSQLVDCGTKTGRNSKDVTEVSLLLIVSAVMWCITYSITELESKQHERNSSKSADTSMQRRKQHCNQI